MGKRYKQFADTMNSVCQVTSQFLLNDTPALRKELNVKLTRRWLFTTILGDNYVHVVFLPFYKEAEHENQ